MAKRTKPGYPCEVCHKTRTGAHTDVLKNDDGSVKLSTSECPLCFTDGKHQKYSFEVHLDSYGNQEMVSGKCPTHGHIKRIMTAPQDPRFQRNFFDWRTGGQTLAPPKILREV